MRTGGGGTRPADAGPATCSCSGGPHRLRQGLRRTPTVRTSTVRTPILWTPTAVLGAAADSQGVRGVRFRSRPDTGCGVRQDGGGLAAPLRRDAQDRACRSCSSALVSWPGRGSQRRTAVWMCGHRTRPAGHREPARPALRTPATAAGAWRRCGSGHAGQPAARTVHHPAAMSDRNGTPMCGIGQHARLTARSVVWGRPET
jgi:hypothetical protein